MKDNPNYQRQNDGSVINTNTAELNSYLEARKRIKNLQEQEKRIESLEKTVEGLDLKLNLILEKLS